jgi:hypothetical protein
MMIGHPDPDQAKRVQIRALLQWAWAVENARTEYNRTKAGSSKIALDKAEKEFHTLLKEIEGDVSE